MKTFHSFPIFLLVWLALPASEVGASDRAVSTFVPIFFDNETYEIAVDAHDYAVSVSQLGGPPATITVYNGSRLIREMEVTEGYERFKNTRARLLTFVTEGSGAFALLDPTLSDNHGAPKSSLTQVVAGPMAWSVFRDSENACVTVDSERSIFVEIRDVGFRIAQASQNATRLTATVDDTWGPSMVFVRADRPSSVTVAVSDDGCGDGKEPAPSISLAVLLAAIATMVPFVRPSRRW